MKTATPLSDKFQPEPNTGCWLWTYALNPNGYGQHAPKYGVNIPAHRAMYEAVKGRIPAGLELDHLCRQRSCVNPDHLEPVTHTVNVRRAVAPDRKIGGRGFGGANLQKTHCPQGHPYSGPNLRIVRAGRCSTATGRQCRECARIRDNLRHGRIA